MVKSMHLSEIIQISDIAERNQQLRKAFVAYTENVEVSGCELELLTVAANLTLPRAQVEDLMDVSLAKSLFQNKTHLKHCIEEVQWFHTHNLKYPDARVSKQRILVQSPELCSGVISGANLPFQLGWSHNSAQVNPAKLFLIQFIRRGENNTLLDVLVNLDKVWKHAFLALGVTPGQLHELKRQVLDVQLVNRLPEEVSEFSKQIRVPIHDDYCALTPVVSHSVQAYLHQLIYDRQFQSKLIEHSHPASVGSLVASVGGNTRVLFYPPRVRRAGAKSFFDRRGENGLAVYDHSVLKSRSFINALGCIAGEHPAPVLRQRRQLRISALRYIRKQLALWLAPMMDLRDSLGSEQADVSSIHALEEKLLYLPIEQLPTVLNELNIQLHLGLQKATYAARYAYHPNLMAPLKHQLSWLLRYLARPEERMSQDGVQSMFIHIRQLKVHDASLMSNPYVAGVPSLTALGGFMHHYQRRLTDMLENPCTVVKGAWFISQYHIQAGKQLPEPSLFHHRSKVSNVQRPGIIDGVHGDLEMDLVLEIRFPDATQLPDLMCFQAAFPSRFAGGTMHPPSLYEQVNWLSIYRNKAELFRILSRLPRSGCWIYPEDKGVNSFEALAFRLKAEPDLRPIGMGFLPLEQPRERKNSLSPLHCYAEPCIGVIRCMNAIDVRLAGKKAFFESAFWHFDTAIDAMLMKKAP